MTNTRSTSQNIEILKNNKILNSLKEITKKSMPTTIPLKTSLKEIISDMCFKKQQDEDFKSFYLFDLSHVVKQYQKWVELMPRVRPYYAVKCNPDKNMIAILKELGCGFDCASLNEIGLVMSMKDGKKLDPNDDIIFANPCKQVEHIKYAKSQNVTHCTFDSPNELRKLKKFYPEAKVLLRLAVDDSKSICRFSSKFGVPFEDAEGLIKLTKDLGLNLAGISFHVGSGCTDANAFVDAVKDAKKLFNIAKEKYGIKMSILDVGGGFPGLDNDEYSNISFAAICKAMYPVINKLFPAEENYKIIAEPGRYFACGTSTLVCNVYCSKKINSSEREVDYMYYVNDGVYQSFNCIFFDHYTPFIKTLKKDEIVDKDGNKIEKVVEDLKEKKFPSKLFGPTCDSMDTISSCVELPVLKEDDWIYVENFGAYTISASCAFNGYDDPEIYYYWRS
jgi:ornithine decarboxylase